MLELKLVKLVASAHRGVIALAYRGVTLRGKLADKRLDRKLRTAQEMRAMATHLKEDSQTREKRAHTEHTETKRKLLAAENALQNAQDDLNSLTKHI